MFNKTEKGGKIDSIRQENSLKMCCVIIHWIQYFFIEYLSLLIFIQYFFIDMTLPKACKMSVIFQCCQSLLWVSSPPIGNQPTEQLFLIEQDASQWRKSLQYCSIKCNEEWVYNVHLLFENNPINIHIGVEFKIQVFARKWNI